jgi:hypothetical protein
MPIDNMTQPLYSYWAKLKQNDTKEKIEAQEHYCYSLQLELLAMERCPSCNKNVYEKITLEEASKVLITGCPHCNYSFCE